MAIKKTAKKVVKQTTTTDDVQVETPVVSKTETSPCKFEKQNCCKNEITLRDFYVANALVALQTQRFPTYADRAKAAFELADELLKQR
jgi:hypothetical protein